MSACVDGSKNGAAGQGAGASSASAAGIGGSSAAIKVEGRSIAISSDIKTINVVTPPVTWTPDGSPAPGTVLLSGRAAASAPLKAHAPGAYTTLPWGNQALSLSTGTVTDIAGDGQFAIGRWTAGSDSAGQSFNVNQGRVWAVGAPVEVKLPWGGMKCALTAATRPTAGDGNTAPGLLSGATAIVAPVKNARGVVENRANVSLQYSIGKDLDRTFTAAVPLGWAHTSRTTRSSVYTTFLGPNASKPYLVVAYGVHSPTVGLINGLAVLNCS